MRCKSAQRHLPANPELNQALMQVARTDDTPNMKGLKDIIRYVKPHILIGLTGGGPAFDQVSLSFSVLAAKRHLHDQPCLHLLNGQTAAVHAISR